MASPAEVEEVRSHIDGFVGNDELLAISDRDESSVQRLAQIIAEGDKTAVLIGRSGVGKSSLVNMLVGSDIQNCLLYTSPSEFTVMISCGHFLAQLPQPVHFSWSITAVKPAPLNRFFMVRFAFLQTSSATQQQGQQKQISMKMCIRDSFLCGMRKDRWFGQHRRLRPNPVNCLQGNGC